jgi:N6-adenosine-specific RNA methylase IME4
MEKMSDIIINGGLLDLQDRYSVILTPRMGHSVKPDIHDRIRAMYPNGKALEMFARRPMAGWDSYGNQLADEREQNE